MSSRIAKALRPEMECPEEKVLADYVSGGVSAADTEATSVHLTKCDDCRAVVEW